MIDRERVIKELDKLVDEVNPWKESPPLRCDIPYPLLCDALALLKEQEAEIKRLKKPDCEHANHDGAGCLGYCGCEQDDEPIDACKQCKKYTGNICAEY